MNSTVNYQKQMDILTDRLSQEKIVPTLFLHSCCAPCSSYVIEYLSDFFAITVFFYNPNISNLDEYNHRKNEQIRFISQKKTKYPVSFVEGKYDHNDFLEVSIGLENEPERGKRCLKCYHLRLEQTAINASALSFDYFATTLTLSPLKNAHAINSIGQELSKKYGVEYLCSDFKKKNGYKRSIELSREFSLYRQNFCGCEFSCK